MSDKMGISELAGAKAWAYLKLSEATRADALILQSDDQVGFEFIIGLGDECWNIHISAVSVDEEPEIGNISHLALYIQSTPGSFAEGLNSGGLFVTCDRNLNVHHEIMEFGG
jgi:hypothetical protein